MIFILIFITISVATAIAIVRSEKPVKHILAEARYEFVYNVIGSRALLEDITRRSKNKTNLFKRQGKIALITGGTRGIGVEVIKMLMQCDMHVIMGCRNPDAGETMLKKIRDEGVKTGELKVYKLDISSLASTREFANAIKDKYPQIDCLINNAGIMYVPYSESVDGIESQFATNYLGHFLLTHLLLDSLKRSGRDGENARIINVSSCAYLSGAIDFDNINKKEMYISFEAYSQSKLAQILFTNYLNEILKKDSQYVQVHSIHPGVVDTDLFDNTYVKTFFGWLIPYIFKTPEEGARTIVHSCISPDLEGKGGTYISNCTISAQKEIAKDKDVQEKLFNLSKKLVNIEIYGKESAT